MVSKDLKLDKVMELKNSSELKAYTLSKYPEYDNVINFLFKEMVAYYGLVLRQSGVIKLRNHLKFYVLNLYKAHLRNPDMVIAYSNDINWYSKWNKNHRKLKLSYPYSVGFPTKGGKPALTFLEQHKYIRTWSSMRNPAKHDKSYQPRMRARGKLIKLIEQYGIKDQVIVEDRSDDELIVFKGKKLKSGIRKVCKTPNTKPIRQMRSNLKKINALMEKSDIRVTIPDEALEAINAERKKAKKKPIKMPDFSRTRLHRVFHDRSVQRHGRYYGAWYEGIYKELRPYITIDGAPTLELDFSSLHAYLCYKLAGTKPPAGDLYQLDEYTKDTRKVIKKIFFNMLNAKTKKAARGATRNWITGWQGVGKELKKDKPQIPDELGNLKSGTDLDNLMDKILTKHKPIRHYFFNPEMSGILTNIDGQITDHILRYYTSMDIPVLPIHDSYVIDARLVYHLQKYMHKVIREGLGISIPISKADIKGLASILAVKAEQKIFDDPDDPATIEFLKESLRFLGATEKLQKEYRELFDR